MKSAHFLRIQALGSLQKHTFCLKYFAQIKHNLQLAISLITSAHCILQTTELTNLILPQASTSLLLRVAGRQPGFSPNSFQIVCSGQWALEKRKHSLYWKGRLLLPMIGFLLQQPFVVNYPQLTHSTLQTIIWTSMYCLLMFYFTTLLLCLDVNTSKNRALQIAYQTHSPNHRILNLNRLFILISCHRNACSGFCGSAFAKFLSSANFTRQPCFVRHLH